MSVKGVSERSVLGAGGVLSAMTTPAKIKLASLTSYSMETGTVRVLRTVVQRIGSEEGLGDQMRF